MSPNLFNAVAHPGSEKPDLSHPASHGSSNNSEHEPSTGIFDLLTSNATTKQIKSQGNNGHGMEKLHDKAINQQERVAERSRLSGAGMFEPHLKHEELTNLTAEHRAVADGKHVFPADSSSARQV